MREPEPQFHLGPAQILFPKGVVRVKTGLLADVAVLSDGVAVDLYRSDKFALVRVLPRHVERGHMEHDNRGGHQHDQRGYDRIFHL
jgi:hypothetical protein